MARAPGLSAWVGHLAGVRAVLHGPALGWLALAVTLSIWAGFFLSLRAGARAALAPSDLAALRFLPAAALLAPLAWRSRGRLRQVPLAVLAVIVAGAGLPYFLLAGMALRGAPAADGAALIPGTLALSTALLATTQHGRKALRHWPALLLIALGVALLMGFRVGPHVGLRAYGLFLLCSVMWSAYTLALREARLAPLEAAAVIAVVSGLMLLPWLMWHPPVALLHVPASQLMGQVLVQGVGVGLVSTASYGFAVARLGPQRCATAGALTPLMVSGLAWMLLGEAPSLAVVGGMGLMLAGVLWAQQRR